MTRNRPARERAEALVRKWLADCRPMIDAVDVRVLVDRIAAEIENLNKRTER